MRDKYQAEAYIGQKYGYTNYCTPETAFHSTFDAHYAAILVPKKPWNSGPHYRIHRVRDDGTLGQTVDKVEFEEARHVGA